MAYLAFILSCCTLLHLAYAITSATFQIVPSHCQHGIRERKEIRNLSSAEWKLFKSAILSLMRNGKYDHLVKMHYESAIETHSYPLFFTWHRAYLIYFEQLLQKFNPSIMVPYWNWALDSQAPELSVVFTSKFFGGNGNLSQNETCVKDGPFKDWRPKVPTPHCLKRKWQATTPGLMTSFVPTEVLEQLVVHADSYNALRIGFETPMHNLVHFNIGGDMPTPQSTNDPIFWIHHGFVDKIWADWQLMHRQISRNYGGVNRNGSIALDSDDLLSFNGLKVVDVMDTWRFCYKYMELEVPSKRTVFLGPLSEKRGERHSLASRKYRGGYKVAVEAEKLGPTQTVWVEDRFSLTKLRIPAPLPEDFLIRYHVNVTLMRQFESIYANEVKKINSMDGYVSPCSLWMHEDYFAKLLGKVNTTKTFSLEHKDQKISITVTKKHPKCKKKERPENLYNLVWHIKDLVREQIGGSLRTVVTKGIQLKSLKAVDYPYTQPLLSTLDKY